jgi:hypothetical protein
MLSRQAGIVASACVAIRGSVRVQIVRFNFDGVQWTNGKTRKSIRRVESTEKSICRTVAESSEWKLAQQAYDGPQYAEERAIAMTQKRIARDRSSAAEPQAVKTEVMSF